MKLFQTDKYPRRVYIESDEGEMNKLSLSVYMKFQINPANSGEDEVDTIFFKCEEMDKIYFPSGLVNVVTAIATANGITIESMDLLPKNYDTEAGNRLHPDMLSGITLRDYQMEGTHAGLYHRNGLLQIPTGGGKTEMMSAVARYILDHTDGYVLIGVPSTNLLTQTYDRLIKRGIPEEEISMLGGGHGFTPRRVIISTVQSCYNRLKKKDKEFMEWKEDVKALLMDEAHHGSARTWFTIVDGIKADYVLGFSAEPFYNDQAHIVQDMLLRGSLGSVLYRIPLKVLIQRGYLSQPYVFAMRSTYNGNILKLSSWHQVNKVGIIQNTFRNKLIVDVTDWLIRNKKNPLVLISQIQHGKDLALEMSKLGHRIALLTGGQSVALYQDGICIDEFTDPEEKTKEDFKNGIVDAMIGTSVMDEGVDMPSLAAVVLAGGGKSKLKLIQRIGRGLRPKEGDNTTFIVDFADAFNRITHKQFNERKAQFDKNEFPVYFVNDMRAFEYLVQQIKR